MVCSAARTHTHSTTHPPTHARAGRDRDRDSASPIALTLLQIRKAVRGGWGMGHNCWCCNLLPLYSRYFGVVIRLLLFFFLCHWICANKWFAALFCSAQFTHTHTRTLRLMPMECGCHCERDLNSDCDCDCAQCMKNDALGHICRELANWTSGALELDGLLRHLAIVVAPL